MPSREDYARLAMLLAGHMDDLQRLASNLARDVAALMSAKDVEVAVLAEMMVRDFGPPAATAQNRDNSGLQQTEYHALSAALARTVQVIPSGLVITRFPVPSIATAQNRDSSGL